MLICHKTQQTKPNQTNHVETASKPYARSIYSIFSLCMESISNTPTQAKSLLHKLELAARDIGLSVNSM